MGAVALLGMHRQRTGNASKVWCWPAISKRAHPTWRAILLQTVGAAGAAVVTLMPASRGRRVHAGQHQRYGAAFQQRRGAR